MADLKQRLHEDRVMRDTAKRLVSNDVSYLKDDVDQRSVGKRMTDRMREGAEGLGDEATGFVRENPVQTGSIVALGAGLVAAWFFQDEILDAVESLWDGIDV